MSSPSPQPTPVTSTSTSEPWAAQKPYLEYGFDQAKKIYTDAANPSFYPGQTYAPASAETNAAGAFATDEALKTIRGDYLDPSKNAGLRNLIDSTMARSMPGVMSPYIGANRTGSGLYGRAVGEGIASGVAPLYQAEREKMINAPGQLAQVGALREQWAQKPIDEAMSRYDFNTNLGTNKLANYMQMVQGNYGGTNTSTGVQYLPKTNTLGSILGGLMGGVGLLGGTGAFGPAGWLSDRRTKKDIKKVGKTDDGLPVYTYRYKWEGPELPKHMGVMAQDVKKKNPEAVVLMSLMGKPVLGVDYSKVQ